MRANRENRRTAKEGDWTKVTGGDFGAVYHNGQWWHFECLYCSHVRGEIKSENKRAHADVSGRAREVAARKPFDRVHPYPIFTCGGNEVHRQFFAMKAAGAFSAVKIKSVSTMRKW